MGFTVDRAPGSHTYETPILDLNYGWGDRIQLKFELPYLLQGTNGAPIQSGLGNSLAGVKWRFYQRKDHDFAISTYPQLEFNNPTDSVRRNIVNRAPNFLLPMEVTYRVGPLALDGEAGYWFNSYASNGYIAGFALSHQAADKLELLTEVYHQVQVRGTERDSTFGFGGRYELRKGMLLLFMAGRSFFGASSEQSQFIGYVGMQFQIQKEKPAGRCRSRRFKQSRHNNRRRNSHA